jgi:hypothetical protein
MEPGSRAAELDQVREGAFHGLRGLVLRVVGASGAVAVVTVLTLDVSAGSRERFPMSVSAALGAPPRRLLLGLLRARTGPLMWGVLGGAAAGVALAGVLGATWPGVTRWDHLPKSPVWLSAAVALVVLAVTLLPLRYAREPLAPRLAVDRRGSDPWEGGFRRILAVLQIALALGLVAGVVGPITGSWGASTLLGAPSPGDHDARTVILPLALEPDLDAQARRARWLAVLERARELSTLSAESLATPGAWSGLGRVDVVVAECGDCVRGGLPVAMLGEGARHLVVTPDFFRQTGLRILAGRPLSDADGADSPRVALVSESFALENFEDGQPVGRRIRVGRGRNAWHRVVGVVEETPGVALGRIPGREPTVYLSVWQHPPDRVDLALTVPSRAASEYGDEMGPPSGIDLAPMTFGPVAMEGPILSVAEVRRREAAPIRWAILAAAAAGLVALMAALGGTGAVARVEVRARTVELGIRSALGATETRLVRHVLARTLGSVVLGAVLSLPVAVAVAGALRSTSGSLPLLDPLGFGGLVGATLVAAVLGSMGPAQRAGRTNPAQVMTSE